MSEYSKVCGNRNEKANYIMSEYSNILLRERKII